MDLHDAPPVARQPSESAGHGSALNINGPSEAAELGAVSPLLLSQDEAARLRGVERTTIWRMCCRRDLDRVHIGRRSLVTRASIDSYIASQLQRV